MRHLFATISILLVLTSCVDLDRENPAEIQRIIDEGVRIKLTDFQQKEWAKCLAQAEKLAIAETDSIIRARARFEAVEPVPKPPRPERPEKPPTKTVSDSLRADTLRSPN